ncbi:UNKNOWN [Stylonychia lemnae]|uniref:Uncharacterized protein n=1 Tax=Stylonychia lemnae TaxID=5949 RepID=A0A078B8N9_STYLE|nr:UNKNOWN [Stylonychia lemnae]|eukprot:CDW89677.1 UNKNOWN [Stylonychia lemnae]
MQQSYDSSVRYPEKKKPKIPIQSQGAEKYQELSEIQEQIQSMTVVPDFGYDKNQIEFKDISGWKLFYDFVQREPKFQKLQKYIKERNQEIREKQKLQKKKKTKKQNQDDIDIIDKDHLVKSKVSKDLEQLISIHKSENDFLRSMKTISRFKTSTNNSLSKPPRLPEKSHERYNSTKENPLLGITMNGLDTNQRASQTEDYRKLSEQEKELIKILRPYEKDLVYKLQELITKPFNILEKISEDMVDYEPLKPLIVEFNHVKVLLQELRVKYLMTKNSKKNSLDMNSSQIRLNVNNNDRGSQLKFERLKLPQISTADQSFDNQRELTSTTRQGREKAYTTRVENSLNSNNTQSTNISTVNIMNKVGVKAPLQNAIQIYQMNTSQKKLLNSPKRKREGEQTKMKIPAGSKVLYMVGIKKLQDSISNKLILDSINKLRNYDFPCDRY